jgi:amino acid transporter
MILITSVYLRFRRGLKVQNLLKTDILPVKGHLQPLSGWWLVVWAPIIFIFKYVFSLHAQSARY